MPGSLLEGYMAGKRYLQEREEKEEEGKREKLNDQIRELEFKRLTRGLERSAEEWEQKKKKYQQEEEAILQLPEEQRPHARLGLRLPEEREPAYPWMGTRYEEEGAEKQFHIQKPTGPTLPETDEYWLGQPFSKTPPGKKNRLTKAGYRQKAGTDEWEPAPKATTGDWLDDLLGGEEGTEVVPGSPDAIILEQQKQIKELLEKMSK